MKKGHKTPSRRSDRLPAAEFLRPKSGKSLEMFGNSCYNALNYICKDLVFFRKITSKHKFCTYEIRRIFRRMLECSAPVEIR